MIDQCYKERSTTGKKAKEHLRTGISTLNLDKDVKEADTSLENGWGRAVPAEGRQGGAEVGRGACADGTAGPVRGAA